jgi:hypothetical protein
MADSVTNLGPRSDADVALDLMRFVYSLMPAGEKPKAEKEFLAFYERCATAILRALN